MVASTDTKQGADALLELIGLYRAHIARLEGALAQMPTDPYPLAMCSMDDSQYVALVPDPAERTSLSWFLVGEGYRLAMADVQRIREQALAPVD